MHLCDPMDYTVHGILQARILEWVAFPFSKALPALAMPRHGKAAENFQNSLQVDSLPAEPPGKPKNTEMSSPSLLWGNLPNPGIELGSPALQMDPLSTELSGNLLLKLDLQTQDFHFRVSYVFH